MRPLDKDDMTDALKKVKEAVMLLEKQLKLFVDHNPMFPDSFTPTIQKLHRTNVDYAKLLIKIEEELIELGHT
mgnify:CR=1 FL=1